MIIGLMITGVFLFLILDASEKSGKAYLEYLKNNPDE